MAEGTGTLYNIIDSVKGGCGKTSFSIMLALAADELRKTRTAGILAGTTDKDADTPESCLIDMDIQGTALAYLLFGEGYFQDPSSGRNFLFLNERVRRFEDPADRYVAPFEWDGYRFDTILSSPLQRDKNHYRALAGQNYSPEIMCSTFREGLLSMLKKLNEQNPYRYKYVLFDMPPNSDGYSDAVFDCMLNEKYSIMKKADLCNLFIVQTTDISHRLAAINYFEDFIAREHSPKLNKIFFVYNDFLDFAGVGGEEALFKDAVKYTKDRLINCLRRKGLQNKVYFVALRFFEDYYRICSVNDGIKNQSVIKAVTKPVRCLLNWDMEDAKTDPKDAETDCLFRLMGQKD